MGFEQLAVLREHLEAQTKHKKQQEKRARKPKAPETATPVDPVILAIAKLQKRFPLVFPKNPAPKVPLKVGIFKDLLEHAPALKLSEEELRNAMRTWCRGARYWACLVEGAARVSLDGEPAGQVTAAEAASVLRFKARRVEKAAAPS